MGGRSRASALREFLTGGAGGGVTLMGAALLALVVANSPLGPSYFATLKSYAGPLSIGHWINDGLMAAFFLLVGLEIKREFLDGELSTWPRRVLPGVAAAGGMAVPALIYIAFNSGNPETLRGWAIPTATDIAFALGVLSLLGSRVPASLKVFLTALAIIDDLGAVLIIALFYTAGLSVMWLAAAVAIVAALTILNRAGVIRLLPYVLLGVLLWFVVLKSGVHATLAGVVLALTIPMRLTPVQRDTPESSPLHTLEHMLQKPVAFFVIPLFGFANAGVSFAGTSSETLFEPLTLGIALGLLGGKVIGVFGTATIAIRLGLADMPANAARMHLVGVSLLCGIGFTMSLFIGLLAFPAEQHLQDALKIGILSGSLLSAILGSIVLLMAPAPGGPESRQ